MKLNVGSHNKKIKGYYNLDGLSLENVDIVSDLNDVPFKLNVTSWRGNGLAVIFVASAASCPDFLVSPMDSAVLFESNPSGERISRFSVWWVFW